MQQVNGHKCIKMGRVGHTDITKCIKGSGRSEPGATVPGG